MAQIKETGLWNLFKRTYRYLNKYFLISRIIRYSAYAIAIIEASAILILIFGAIITLLPILALILFVRFLVYRCKNVRYDKQISEDVLASSHVVFIKPKNQLSVKKSEYLYKMGACFCEEGYTVVIISGRLFEPTRPIRNGIWLISQEYYYSLKKQILTNQDDKLIYIF